VVGNFNYGSSRGPLSNAQRQQRFRDRHPDYYRKRRAEAKVRIAEQCAVMQRQAVKPVLMLPAPSELNAVERMMRQLHTEREKALVEVELTARQERPL
jgi:hypothetical protein